MQYHSLAIPEALDSSLGKMGLKGLIWDTHVAGKGRQGDQYKLEDRSYVSS
jgi:hypothetical protein